MKLSNSNISIDLDPDRGAEVLTLVDQRTGIDLLFTAPWRAHADAVRAGQRPASFDPVAGWLEQYRGGWQTLCPNAGQPRVVHGAPVAFHGEASVVPWTVGESSITQAELRVDLFLVPIRIERVIELDGPRVCVRDRLTNLGGSDLEFDYSSHPAIGGVFLDSECHIDTGAERFVSDPESPNTLLGPGTTHEWPWAITATGERVDLRVVPPPGVDREVFGWLEDFSAHWVQVTNPTLDLGVRIEWDGRLLPYAWLWQELTATRGFPWYRRARALAVEPASMQTSGPHRRSVLHLGQGDSLDLEISVATAPQATGRT